MEKNLIVNYDKVYFPMFSRLVDRHNAFQGFTGKGTINKQKLEYDIDQGIRDQSGNYLVLSLQDLSKWTKYALLSKQDFIALVEQIGGNTINTLDKNASNAKKNENKKLGKKSETHEKAAATRKANAQVEALDDLFGSFKIGELILDIVWKTEYGNMGIGEIQELSEKIVAAMLVDNGITQQQKQAYDKKVKVA
jgi:hypothetical protein